MSKWMYDGSCVCVKYIEEIWEFLDKTPNYLFFGSGDEEECLLPTEKEIKNKWSRTKLSKSTFYREYIVKE